MGSKKLLAGFCCKTGVVERQDYVANGHMTLALVLLKTRGQLEVFNISRAVPWSEKSVFSKVSAQKIVNIGAQKCVELEKHTHRWLSRFWAAGIVAFHQE